jgi:hypothetical protein
MFVYSAPGSYVYRSRSIVDLNQYRILLCLSSILMQGGWFGQLVTFACCICETLIVNLFKQTMTVELSIHMSRGGATVLGRCQLTPTTSAQTLVHVPQYENDPSVKINLTPAREHPFMEKSSRTPTLYGPKREYYKQISVGSKQPSNPP